MPNNIKIDNNTGLPIYINTETKQKIVFLYGVKNLPLKYDKFFDEQNQKYKKV